ncbi:CHRD domain-containing protein [Aeoliella sp.]|uniref:CHRD domain-containing protein n=1 Tax=Aeoliella sp. TaxID=2795800 RepID=UPI003CCBB7F1
MNSRIGCFVALLGLSFSSPAFAELWQWDDILLDGSQENPPVATPGTGLATAMLDTDTGIMSIEGTFSDLIGTTTLAHLHGIALPDQNAGVIFGLNIDVGVTSGSFSGTSGVLNQATMDGIIAGNSYINIHTSFRQGGEIRGQVTNGVQVPEPSSIALTLLATGALLGYRWRRK